jgi:hypothetical protein
MCVRTICVPCHCASDLGRIHPSSQQTVPRYGRRLRQSRAGRVYVGARAFWPAALWHRSWLICTPFGKHTSDCFNYQEQRQRCQRRQRCRGAHCTHRAAAATFPHLGHICALGNNCTRQLGAWEAGQGNGARQPCKTGRTPFDTTYDRNYNTFSLHTVSE